MDLSEEPKSEQEIYDILKASNSTYRLTFFVTKDIVTFYPITCHFKTP